MQTACMLSPGLTGRGFLLSAIFIFSLLNALIIVNHTHKSQNSRPASYSWVGHDFPETFPLVMEPETVLMTVEESAMYSIDGTGNAAWRSLTTSSRGYCRLGPQHRLFAVSMFHELHCLRILNSAFGARTQIGHAIHCLSYLRHGVLCSADLTLEQGDFALRNFSRDRVGATHQCRDWTVVYEAMEDNWKHWNTNRANLVVGDD